MLRLVDFRPAPATVMVLPSSANHSQPAPSLRASIGRRPPRAHVAKYASIAPRTLRRPTGSAAATLRSASTCSAERVVTAPMWIASGLLGSAAILALSESEMMFPSVMARSSRPVYAVTVWFR